jgi:hypothetical protein
MRGLVTSLSLVLLVAITVYSCKKWEDPAPTNDPRISNPYCNDPEAVNYNWGFPGKPDNSVCVYPADLFAGNYKVHDTIYKADEDLFLRADSMDVQLVKLSNTKLSVIGMCPGGAIIRITAATRYGAWVDTTAGDSLSLHPGHIFCRQQDTVTGTLSRDRVDSSLMYMDLTVWADTGATIHRARAVKKM